MPIGLRLHKVTARLKPSPSEEKRKMTEREHMERVTKATDAYEALTVPEKKAFLIYHGLKVDDHPHETGLKEEAKKEEPKKEEKA